MHVLLLLVQVGCLYCAFCRSLPYAINMIACCGPLLCIHSYSITPPVCILYTTPVTYYNSVCALLLPSVYAPFPSSSA